MIEIREQDGALRKLLPPIKPRPDTIYVPSQFALPFDCDGRMYVYQTLTKQCLQAELPPSARAGEGFDALIERRFLVPEGKDECAEYQGISAMMRAFRQKKGIPSYTILPTFGCNARCVYCYEEGTKPIAMTPETVEQTLRFILDTRADGEVDLTWFGGEPLLRPDVIDRVCEGLREAGVGYRSRMVSNGSLITSEIVEKMKTGWNLKEIQVSMDGAEDDYRRRKCYCADSDQYHRVIESVSRMSEAGISVTIRCNVDGDNWPGVPAFLEDLKNGVAHKENVRLYFRPLYAVCGSDDSLAMWEKIRDARPMIESAGFQPTSLFKLSRTFRVHYCLSDNNCAVITPDGSLYACECFPPASRYGDIWNGATDEQARQAFCRTDVIREKCRKCTFLPECTGFSNCPVYHKHCRGVQELTALDALRRMVRNRDVEEDAEPLDC